MRGGQFSGTLVGFTWRYGAIYFGVHMMGEGLRKQPETIAAHS